MKRCNLGDHWTDESEFRKHKTSKDGLDFSCAACRNKAQNERRREQGRSDRTDSMPSNHVGSFTEVRHHDPVVMENNVRKKILVYARRRKKLKFFGLTFKSNSVDCDRALKTPAPG